MRKKWLVLLAVILVLATVVAAMVHKSGQKEGDDLTIKADGQELTVPYEKLNQVSFEGELIDGKGDVTDHKYKGVLLREILETQGITVSSDTTIVVTSADQFSAEFTGAEIAESDNIYLAVWADGAEIENIDGEPCGIQCIAFGDPNSKRCVRFTSMIEVK